MLCRQEILPTVARQGTEASWQRLCTAHISFFKLAEVSFCHPIPQLQVIKLERVKALQKRQRFLLSDLVSSVAHAAEIEV
ncbi:hypothetical protein TIFTF001_003095 [Ficus carica]|uniref:Uncharacterized protein n=1 Tax=Ficus carica TaxID=3494 RepID=A0AA87ZG19_FICCA|nr:hypothetical protein TIFTF001_003095 [Ficus carica]